MKTRKNLLCLTLLCSLSLFTSCSKDDENDAATLETVDATLRWSGDYAVDGCGFSLMIGEGRHKPVNESDISATYKQEDPIEVEVKIINYHKNVNVCQTGVAMNSIKVLDILRK